jgi:hypothetical protein
MLGPAPDAAGNELAGGEIEAAQAPGPALVDQAGPVAVVLLAGEVGPAVGDGDLEDAHGAPVPLEGGPGHGVHQGIDAVEQVGREGGHLPGLPDEVGESVEVVHLLVDQGPPALLGPRPPPGFGVEIVLGARPAGEPDHPDQAPERLPLDQVAQVGHGGAGASLVGDCQLAPGALGGGDHPVALPDTDRHRLLGHHVLSRLEGRHGHRAVQVVGQGQGHRVHVVPLEEGLVVREPGDAVFLPSGPGRLLVHVADGDQLGFGGLSQSPQVGPPLAVDADDGESHPLGHALSLPPYLESEARAEARGRTAEAGSTSPSRRR